MSEEDPELQPEENRLRDILEDETELAGLMHDVESAAHLALIGHMEEIQRLSLGGESETGTVSSSADANKAMSHLPKHWKLFAEYDFTPHEEEMRLMEVWSRANLGYTPYRYQLEGAMLVHRGEDVMIMVRTGGGKSTVFQLLLADIRLLPNPDPICSTILVISPLVALLKDQVRHFNSKGIPSCALIADNVKFNKALYSQIDAGQFRAVFASPEILLRKGSHFWVKMAPKRKNHLFLRNLKCIAIDECHCAYKYGESSFRPEYAKLGSFRHFFHDVPFCCLSATVPPNVREYLFASLKLSKPTYFLQQSILRFVARVESCPVTNIFPRDNIDLNFIPISNTMPLSELDFMVDNYAHWMMIPKSIIYVDSRASAQGIANYLRRVFKSTKGGSTMTRTELKKVFSVFTAIIPSHLRDQRMASFMEGDTRILICTDAAGMGMHVKNVERMVQFGIAKYLTISDLVQRVGRCARDAAYGDYGAAFIFVQDKYIYEDRYVNFTLRPQRQVH